MAIYQVNCPVYPALEKTTKKAVRALKTKKKSIVVGTHKEVYRK